MEKGDRPTLRSFTKAEKPALAIRESRLTHRKMAEARACQV